MKYPVLVVMAGGLQNGGGTGVPYSDRPLVFTENVSGKAVQAVKVHKLQRGKGVPFGRGNALFELSVKSVDNTTNQRIMC